MVSTPILAYCVVTEQHWWAIGGCTLAAISDYLDGYLAKRYGWSTVLGTYLDPLADKAFVNTLGVGLWYTGILPTPLVVLWATKDVMLLSGTAMMLYKQHGSVSILTNSVSQEPLKVTPSMIAKINTTLQFATLVVGLMSPVMPIPPLFLDGLIWTTGGTTIGTVISYGARSGMDASGTKQNKI
jgi:cardiolipin synthase (CMP-forming)